MPRRRWIDPSFWDDLTIGKLRPIERLFFIGCFSNADDEGRLIGNPAYLRATIFKYDDMTIDDITEIRDNVVGVSCNLVCYSANGEDYLAFRQWSKHQKPNYPKESQLPPPPFLEAEGSRSEDEPKSEQPRAADMGRAGQGRVKVGQGSGRSADGEGPSGDDAVPALSLDILSRLECLGIQNPARKELAALPHVTLDYLETWRLWWQDGGAKKLDNPPGYLVQRIRAGDLPP